MLSDKPWRTEAVVRLLVGIFVCMFAGWVAGSVAHYCTDGSKTAAVLFFPLAAAAIGFLAASLVLLHRPLQLENLTRQVGIFMACFYAGLLLTVGILILAGKTSASAPSAGVGFMNALFFQAAAMVLTGIFIRDHQMTWTEAFGWNNHWRRAVLLGVVAACVFMPVACALQQVSAKLMTLPHLGLKPEEQQTVQAIRATGTAFYRVLFAVITILLVPPAEEILFRGIAYPFLKRTGHPRLALWGTALFFAAIHLNMLAFLPLLALALLLTWLYERTNNLLAPILAHSMFNALNFALLYLQERYQEPLRWLTGG
jgi:membrane protease YdiL (CAAX protease family)